MASNTRRRRPKAGSIAIPFLITILISLIVLGGVGYYFYGKLTENHRELQTLKSATTSISDEDVNEILFALTPTDTERALPAVMLMRFDPVRKQIFCVGVPINLVIDHDGKDETVRQCLENHGIQTLRNDLGKALDQKIDRYISLDSTGFAHLIALIGNVSYVVTVRDLDLRPSDVSQELETSQFEQLLTSTHYNSEIERNSVIGFSVAALLNQCEGQRISKNIDNYFKTMINSVTTDITAQDFSEHRHAITYMFQNSNGAAARGVTLTYDNDGDNLRLANGATDTLKTTFSQKKTE